MLKILLKIIGLTTVSAHFLSASLDQMFLNDLDVIKLALQTHYAPMQWKETDLGWSLEDNSRAVEQKINSSPGDLYCFQRALTHFLHSLNDHHTQAYFHSTALAYLPFVLECAEGRCIIRSIDQRFPKAFSSSLKVGDELLYWDEISFNDKLASFKNELFGDVDTPTLTALACRYLTFRFGPLGHRYPDESSVFLRVKRGGEAKEVAIQVSWIKFEEKILPPQLQPASLNFLPKIMSCKMSWPTADVIEKGRSELSLYCQDALLKMGNDLERNYRELPDLGKVLWRSSSDSQFKASIFLGPKGLKVGFVRLPTYLLENNDAKKAVDEFAFLMKKFNKETSALVIDQRDNMGGVVLYFYAIASCLIDKHFCPPLQRISLLQEDLAEMLYFVEALESVKSTYDAQALLGKTMFGYPVDYTYVKQLRNYAVNLLESWKRGEILSKPMPLFGIEKILPNPNGCYSKPIVFLIDELDFSGADYMAALLQDNQRAVIFGKKSAGAGGFVTQYAFPNRSAIQAISYTASLGVRKDGSPIEHRGVTPDVPYELTVNDLLNNYQDYRKALLQKLEQVL